MTERGHGRPHIAPRSRKLRGFRRVGTSTISDLVRVLRTGFGIDARLSRYQEASLICPWTGRPWAALSWHPLYRGKVQVIIGDMETRVDPDVALGMVRTHQYNARHQAQVRYQLHRARVWRERQAEAPGPRSLWSEGKRNRRDPHPAAWDVLAFPWMDAR